MNISVTKQPSGDMLDELGCKLWPVWEKEPSEFPWHYDEKETCLIIEGEVTVTSDDGQPISFGAGDLVIFPEGMDCIWNVRTTVRKHYKFGE